MAVCPVRTAVSVDILSKENRTELKDRDLAVLQQEKGTQVLHSLARRQKQIERGLRVERDFE